MQKLRQKWSFGEDSVTCIWFTALAVHLFEPEIPSLQWQWWKLLHREGGEWKVLHWHSFCHSWQLDCSLLLQHSISCTLLFNRLTLAITVRLGPTATFVTCTCPADGLKNEERASPKLLVQQSQLHWIHPPLLLPSCRVRREWSCTWIFPSCSGLIYHPVWQGKQCPPMYLAKL